MLTTYRGGITSQTNLAHEGRLLEAILKAEVRCGVSRLRLATVVPRGPGSRPPGTMTWLRGARCTDPEEMPEKEARPPAQNRHGGAPRGARPDRKGRRASRRVPGLQRYCRPTGCRCTRAPVGAPPTPRSGWKNSPTRAQCAAGTREAVQHVQSKETGE